MPDMERMVAALEAEIGPINAPGALEKWLALPQEKKGKVYDAGEYKGAVPSVPIGDTGTSVINPLLGPPPWGEPMASQLAGNVMGPYKQQADNLGRSAVGGIGSALSSAKEALGQVFPLSQHMRPMQSLYDLPGYSMRAPHEEAARYRSPLLQALLGQPTVAEMAGAPEGVPGTGMTGYQFPASIPLGAEDRGIPAGDVNTQFVQDIKGRDVSALQAEMNRIRAELGDLPEFQERDLPDFSAVLEAFEQAAPTKQESIPERERIQRLLGGLAAGSLRGGRGGDLGSILAGAGAGITAANTEMQTELRGQQYAYEKALSEYRRKEAELRFSIQETNARLESTQDAQRMQHERFQAEQEMQVARIASANLQDRRHAITEGLRQQLLLRQLSGMPEFNPMAWDESVRPAARVAHQLFDLGRGNSAALKVKAELVAKMWKTPEVQQAMTEGGVKAAEERALEFAMGRFIEIYSDPANEAALARMADMTFVPKDRTTISVGDALAR